MPNDDLLGILCVQSFSCWFKLVLLVLTSCELLKCMRTLSSLAQSVCSWAIACYSVLSNTHTIASLTWQHPMATHLYKP